MVRVATLLLMALTAPGLARGYFAGGGKDAANGNDCLIGWQGIDASQVTRDGKKQVVRCTDCDPTCDRDGESTATGSCTFRVSVCINQSGVEGCAPPSVLDKARAKGTVNGVRVPADDLRIIAPPLEGSVCWPSVDVAVPIKRRKGEGSATLKLSALAKKNKAEGITKTRKDTDTLTYVCVPRPADEACPVSMTTSSTTTSSTTTLTAVSSTTSTTLQSGCFQDLGDGTIRDTCTGLQWEKKDGSDRTPDASNLHDVDNFYSWAGCCDEDCSNYCQPNPAAAATCTALSDGGTTGCGTCASGSCIVSSPAVTTVWDWLNQVNAANFAGHGDWRLPSEGGCSHCHSGGSCLSCDPHELETILLEPYPCGTSPCIDSTFGPTAVPYLYWSASTVGLSPDFDKFAWGVSFETGIATFAYYFKPVPYGYVRAVR